MFEKCYLFYSVELIFLSGQVLLINMNVLKRCVGTTAHLNSSSVANICSLHHLDSDHLWCVRAGDNSHANALGTILPPRIF